MDEFAVNFTFDVRTSQDAVRNTDVSSAAVYDMVKKLVYRSFKVLPWEYLR